VGDRRVSHVGPCLANPRRSGDNLNVVVCITAGGRGTPCTGRRRVHGKPLRLTSLARESSHPHTRRCSPSHCVQVQCRSRSHSLQHGTPKVCNAPCAPALRLQQRQNLAARGGHPGRRRGGRRAERPFAAPAHNLKRSAGPTTSGAARVRCECACCARVAQEFEKRISRQRVFQIEFKISPRVLPVDRFRRRCPAVTCLGAGTTCS
jgi:hypothetical protein